MPQPKYLRIELTRLIDELLALSLTLAQKRECEEDINPRPTKRSKF